MIDTGMDYLPMLAIFMLLADAVYVGSEIGFPLRKINTLSLGENILAVRFKERSKCGHGWSIILGAM